MNQERESEMCSLREIISNLARQADKAGAARPKPPKPESLRQVFTPEFRGASSDAEAAMKAWDADNAEYVKLRLELVQREDRLSRLERDEAEEARTRGLALSALDVVPRVRRRLEAGVDETGEAMQAVKKFEADCSLWCLLLLGGVGGGKSTAAGWFAFMSANKPIPAKFIWSRASGDSPDSGFGEDADKRRKLWRRAEVLIIDDLGTEMLTPTWQQLLDDVLDERYQHSRRTVITCNLIAADFKARYGERIADRIREDGLVATITNKSMRQRREAE